MNHGRVVAPKRKQLNHTCIELYIQPRQFDEMHAQTVDITPDNSQCFASLRNLSYDIFSLYPSLSLWAYARS